MASGFPAAEKEKTNLESNGKIQLSAGLVVCVMQNAPYVSWSRRSFFVVCYAWQPANGRPQTTMVCPTPPTILRNISDADH
jgi:hypothetical protein